MNTDLRATLQACAAHPAEVSVGRARDDQRQQAVVERAAAMTGDEFVAVADMIETLHEQSRENNADRCVMLYELALIGWAEVFESLLQQATQ